MGTFKLCYSSDSDSDQSDSDSPPPQQSPCSTQVPNSNCDIVCDNNSDLCLTCAVGQCVSCPAGCVDVELDSGPINSQSASAGPQSPPIPLTPTFKNTTYATNFSLQYKQAYWKLRLQAPEAPSDSQAPPSSNNTREAAAPFGSAIPLTIALGTSFRPAPESQTEFPTAACSSNSETPSMYPPCTPAPQLEAIALNPSRKRRASTTEFDLRIEEANTAPTMPTVSTSNIPSEHPSDRESGRAFTSYFARFCSPLAFIGRHFVPLAAAVFSFVSLRSNNVVETRVLSSDASHLSIKRPKTSTPINVIKTSQLDTAGHISGPISQHCQSVHYKWATATSDVIGEKNILRFISGLVKAVGTHGIVYDFPGEPNVSHIADDRLKKSIQAAVCTAKVVETLYMSPEFLSLYHNGDPEVRPNLAVGSTKQAQEALCTAIDFVEKMLKEGENSTFALHLSAPKTISEAILEDIRAVRDGCIPPSLTSPAYGSYAEITMLVESKDQVDNSSRDLSPPQTRRSAEHHSSAKARPDRPLPSMRPNIPGILKKGVYPQAAPKRLANAKTMKIVTFRFPLEQPSPQRLCAPRRHRSSRRMSDVKKRVRFNNKEPLSQDLGRYVRPFIRQPPPLPGEGLMSISGEVSLSWEKVQKQREQQDREEAERAEEDRRKREDDERKKEYERLREIFLKTAGLQPAKRAVLEDPTPDMVAMGNRAASNPNMAVAKSVGGTQLHGEDFRKLIGAAEWLNDESVNGILEVLINDINTKEGRERKNNPKILFLSSLGHDFIHKSPVNKIQRSLARQGITAKALKESIETILIPRCKNSHWTLGVIRPQDKIMFHLDSIRGGNSKDMIDFLGKIVQGVLQDEYVPSEWNIGSIHCAKQNNGYDCGMFTIINSICVATGAQPDFDGRRIRSYRYTICQVLMKGTFDNISSLDLLGKG